MTTLKGSIQLHDGMSKVLKNPIQEITRLNKNLNTVGDNNSLAQQTMQVQKLSQTMNTIKPGALSELIEEGSVNNLSLMSHKISLINSDLANQSVIVQKLNEDYSEAVKLFGVQSERAMKIDSELFKAVQKEEKLATQALKTNEVYNKQLLKIEKTNQALTKKQSMQQDLTKIIKQQGYQLKELQRKVNGLSNQQEKYRKQLKLSNDKLFAKERIIQKLQADKQTLIDKQRLYNEKLKKSNKLVNQLGKSIKKVGGMYLGFLSVRGMQRQFGNWLGLADQRQAIEVPLHVTASNMGATLDEINSIKDKAVELQLKTTYSDDLFLSGGTELARHTETADGIKMLKSPLADMTAGLNGVNATYQDMEKNAQKMGLALNGNYRQMEREGFIFSDTQKEILKVGTELERVAVISDVVASSFNGMSEALTNTPQGRAKQIRNELNSIHENIGHKLQPRVMGIFNLVYDNLPQIEILLMSIGTLVAGGVDFFGSFVFPLLFWGLTGIINLGTGVYDLFANNWTVIEPIVWGIVGAVMAYTVATGALTVKKKLLTKANLDLFKSKLLLAKAMLKPLIIIGLIIGSIHVVIQAFNYWADTSLTTAGVIKGAVFVLGAFIFNIFSHLYNAFLQGIEVVWNTIAVFAEFFANVFIDPIGSVKNLFLSLFNFILGGFANIGRAIDKTIGRIPGINTNAENYFIEAQSKVNSLKTEPAIKVARFDADDYKLNRIEYGEAFKAGYDFNFSNVFGNNEGNIFDMNGYHVNPLGDMMDMQNELLNDIANNTGATAHNTGLMANEINISDEDLKYFKDIAEKETIYRYTSQTVQPEINVYIENVRETADVDEVIDRFTERLEEELFVNTEGVYT